MTCAGFAFLLAFLRWGDRSQKTVLGQSSRSGLWLTTLLLSVAVTIARATMLIVYKSKGSGWLSEDAANLLELLGLKEQTNAAAIIKVSCLLLINLLPSYLLQFIFNLPLSFCGGVAYDKTGSAYTTLPAQNHNNSSTRFQCLLKSNSCVPKPPPPPQVSICRFPHVS